MIQDDGRYTPRAEEGHRADTDAAIRPNRMSSGALLWLAELEASGFVTGTIIAIDGGFSAYARRVIGEPNRTI